jgi:hypothetical protein
MSIAFAILYYYDCKDRNGFKMTENEWPTMGQTASPSPPKKTQLINNILFKNLWEPLLAVVLCYVIRFPGKSIQFCISGVV